MPPQKLFEIGRRDPPFAPQIRSAQIARLDPGAHGNFPTFKSSAISFTDKNWRLGI